MRIIVLGAGHVGRAIVETLHDEHDLTVIDLDVERLTPLSDRFDVRTVEGNGTTRRVLREAGAEAADLLIACSSREDANLVCAMLVKRMSDAQTVVRTTSDEYLEAWREREIDVDFMVSSELETANAISRHVGIPAARQTDVFADGRVQIVEFDVPAGAPNGGVIGTPLRDAGLPAQSKVVAILRREEMVVPRGDATILPGDRIIVIASPHAAQLWSELIAGHEEKLDDIIVFGAGRMGSAIARVLSERGMRVRLIDHSRDCAQAAAAALPEVRVFHADAFDPEFLSRERIGPSSAGVFCMNDDARNLYGAVLAKVHGVALTVALAHDFASLEVYESSGVDVAINPRQVAVEELVRFAHDPRIQQIAMLDQDRFEILDLTVRADSQLANTRFTDLPASGSRIGALIRGDRAIFPDRSEVLRAGDRVIIFVESRRAAYVESVL